MRNAKVARESVWNGQRWFVLYGTLTVASAIMGCGSEEKVVVAVDDNDGLVVDPTSVPCKGTAWSDDVCIAGGEFIMGHKEIPYTPPPCPPGEICGPGDPPAKDFAPAHVVKLSPYFIDRYPATNAEYKACYDAGMCPGDCKMQQTCGGVMIPEYRFTDPLLAAYPVATLTYEGAEAYCLWKGKRLPTEAEWERAARGPKSFDYPWGNEAPDCTRYICNPTDMPAGWSKYWLAPVGANPGDVSPEGVHEMVTSAPQLVHDMYDYYYYRHSPKVNPQGPSWIGAGVARGDVTIRSTLPAPLVYHGVDSPSPAWVRDETSLGGVRCARSDEGATATGEQFFRMRQRVLSGNHIAKN